MKIPSVCALKGISLILLIVIILSGCESFIKLEAWPPPYSLAKGSTLTINKDLPVAPNSVSVYIQYGHVTRWKDLDLDAPNCHFELYTLKSTPQTIYKDEVGISRFVNSNETASNAKLMYASLAADMDDGGSPLAQIFRTEIYLKSAKQPDLYRLSCEVWDDPVNGVYLTVDQIQQTLGSIATFNSPK